MAILRIEHSVPNYETWKQAFDNDPAGRKQSGVRHYQILRSMDEPNYVMIDLEFETRSEAEALLTSMREVWSRVEGTVMWNPQARIVEVVENKDSGVADTSNTPSGATALATPPLELTRDTAALPRTASPKEDL